MIPAGWMAKHVRPRPEWLQAAGVLDVYSVSNCVSNDFADWIGYWRHNGHWLFDSPDIIIDLAREHMLDLSGTSLFYYEIHEVEYAAAGCRTFAPEPSFTTSVVVPADGVLEGYDIVTCSGGGAAECSPLSCNGLAAEVRTNTHCLLATMEEALRLVESAAFAGAEPGPYRIFAVNSVRWSLIPESVP